MLGHQLNYPQPVIQCGGKLITIFYNQQLEAERYSTFHAPWLWHNDAPNIMIPSGQRTNSACSYPGAVIAKATILHVTDLEPSDQIKYMPRHGSTHSILTYGHCDDRDQSAMDSGIADIAQYLVLIYWKDSDADQSGVTMEEKGDKVDYYHKSIFNMRWLENWSYDPQTLKASRLKREVTPEHTFKYKYRSGNKTQERERYGGLLHVDYKTLIKKENNRELLYMMDAVFGDGAVIVNNAPDIKLDSLEETIVSNVGKALGGELSHGYLYGYTFHVKSSPEAINVAYTSHELCPHQDLAYYESKPGFQLLHCKSMPSDIVGGESVLIDCMAAAHILRDLAPELFETLVKCPATFVKQREGACMIYQRPHIVLQQHGGHDLNDMGREIVAIHWAPPFLGPLNIHPDQVPQYYKAYAAFELMLDNSKCPFAYSKNFGIDFKLASKLSEYAKEYTWERRLAPGDVMVFNNNRLLHGRRGFVQNSHDEIRHLIGAYTNVDDSLNKYRSLLETMGQIRVIPNVGNGSIIPGV